MPHKLAGPFVVAALRTALLAFSLLVLVPVAPAGARSNLSDDQIREQMINDSISSYRGSCPCPYNSARNGSSCGKRSAYSKPGGAAPFCYKHDISDEMVRAWRKRNGQ